MEGASLAVRATNAQDEYLTHDPEETFFQVRVPRHTPFALTQIVQPIEGAGLIGMGGSITSPARPRGHVVLGRAADLIGQAYVRTVLPALNTVAITGVAAVDNAASDLRVYNYDGSTLIHTGVLTAATFPAINAQGLEGYSYVDEVAHFLVARATCKIASKTMDTLTSEQQYLDWHASRTGEALMRESIGVGTIEERTVRAFRPQTVYTPLSFWFGSDPSNFLPMCALGRSETRLEFEGRDVHELYGGSSIQSGLGPYFDRYDAAKDDLIVAAIRNAPQHVVYDAVLLGPAERDLFRSRALTYVVTEHVQHEARGVAAGAASYTDTSVPMDHPTRDITVAMRRVSRTRPDAAANVYTPDPMYPVRTARDATGFHTPLQWNDFSGGETPLTFETVAAVSGLQMTVDGMKRLMDDVSAVDIGDFYSDVLPSARCGGATRGTFAQRILFGVPDGVTVEGAGAPSRGTMNLSAVQNVGFTISRAANPMSELVAAAGVFAHASYPPPQYEAVDLFIFSRTINVLRFENGSVSKAYA